MTEQQDRGGDPFPAQGRSLIDKSDAQPGGPRLESNPGHFHGTVAVTVGLDHRHDPHIRTEQAAQLAQVMLDRTEIDLRPGRPLVKERTHTDTPL